MTIRQFTKAGNNQNEDSCYICERFGFVIDGATGLIKQNITNYQTDAQWFSFMFRDYLIEALKDETKTLAEIVKLGIIKIDELFNKFDGAKDVELKPSAAIAIFRLNKNNIEYFVLGDCSIIVKGQDIKVITTEDLAKFDIQNIKLLKKLAEQNNINVVDAKPLINDALKNLRKIKNTKQSYWILSDDIAAVDFAVSGKLDKANVEQIVVVSDGFSQIYDLFKIYSIEEFVNKLYKTANVKMLYKELYKAQQKDCFCNNYPRFKLRDDATLIEMQL